MIRLNYFAARCKAPLCFCASLGLCFLSSQATAFSLSLSGGTLSSFERMLGNGLYSQSEFGHEFKDTDEKNFLLIGGGYFFSHEKFSPALYLSWQNKNWQLFAGTARNSYRHGFLTSNGAYSNFEKEPYIPLSPWGGTLSYRNDFFYSNISYRQKFLLQTQDSDTQKQFFTLAGFSFFKNIFDFYGGYLFDIQNSQSENRDKKNHSLIAAFDIGQNKAFEKKDNAPTDSDENNMSNTTMWLLSIETNRRRDIHSFAQARFKNYAFLLGYYQKHSDEEFSYTFFRDQKQAIYFRSRIYFFYAAAKLNASYARANLRMPIPLRKLKRNFVLYGSYSSKSSSTSGFFLQPPQDEIGFYFGFYWLPPLNGSELSLGIGQEKLFSVEYTFVWLRQEIFAPVNPLFYHKLGDELSQESVPYIKDSAHVITMSIEKNGFSFLLRFHFSEFDYMEETIWNKNIYAKFFYVHTFEPATR